jgi:hypothetical protein
MGIFTLLVTALNTALLSGGLLLAPILAGLVVTAARYFGRRRDVVARERRAERLNSDQTCREWRDPAELHFHGRLHNAYLPLRY